MAYSNQVPFDVRPNVNGWTKNDDLDEATV